MGNIPFSSLGSEGSKRQQIQELAESLLTTFTKEYTAAYAQEYTKHLLGEVDDNSGPVIGSYLLLQRDIHSLQKPKKTGMLTKRGDVVKNWKHRFFVVRSNYTVDYYENEESFKRSAKPKGTILPSGYKVVKDLENAMLKRTRNLAEKMGVDLNEIPAPDKYPDHTFELYHQRRRVWIMTAKDADDMESWCNVFEDCCYHGCGFKNEDPIARRAFPKAMRRTRFECGSGGGWSGGGTEEQVLSDFIVNEVNYKTMGDVYQNIKGNWMIRSKIKEQVDKALDSAVMALVTPGLKSLDAGIQQLRQNLDVLVAQKKDEVAAVERKVMWEMNEQIKDHVDKMLSDLKPTFDKLMEITKGPCEEGLDKAREIFINEVSNIQTKFKELGELDLELHSDDLFHSIDSTNDRKSYLVDRSLSKMFTPLSDIEAPRFIILNMARDILKVVLDSAVYTFQELFMGSAKDSDASSIGEEAAKLADRVKDNVLEQFECDRIVALHHFLFKSIVYAIEEKLRQDLDPVCKPIIKSIQDVIPSALTQVLSVNDMYEKYVNNAVKDMILKDLNEAGLEPPTVGEKKMSVKSESDGVKTSEVTLDVGKETSDHAGSIDKEDTPQTLDSNAGNACDEMQKSDISEQKPESNGEVEEKSGSHEGMQEPDSTDKVDQKTDGDPVTPNNEVTDESEENVNKEDVSGEPDVNTKL